MDPISVERTYRGAECKREHIVRPVAERERRCDPGVEREAAVGEAGAVIEAPAVRERADNERSRRRERVADRNARAEAAADEAFDDEQRLRAERSEAKQRHARVAP